MAAQTFNILGKSVSKDQYQDFIAEMREGTGKSPDANGDGLVTLEELKGGLNRDNFKNLTLEDVADYFPHQLRKITAGLSRTHVTLEQLVETPNISHEKNISREQALVRSNPALYPYLSPELQKDPKIALMAVRALPEMITAVPDSLIELKFVREAAKNNHPVLNYLTQYRRETSHWKIGNQVWGEEVTRLGPKLGAGIPRDYQDFLGWCSRYGIDHPERVGNLEDLVSSIKDKKTPSKQVLLIGPKDDYNDSFESMGETIASLRTQGVEVTLREARTPEEVFEAIKKGTKDFSQKLDGIVLAGHGEKDRLHLGQQRSFGTSIAKEHFDIARKDSVGVAVRRALKTNGFLALHSCDTGSLGEGVLKNGSIDNLHRQAVRSLLPTMMAVAPKEPTTGLTFQKNLRGARFDSEANKSTGEARDITAFAYGEQPYTAEEQSELSERIAKFEAAICHHDSQETEPPEVLDQAQKLMQDFQDPNCSALLKNKISKALQRLILRAGNNAEFYTEFFNRSAEVLSKTDHPDRSLLAGLATVESLPEAAKAPLKGFLDSSGDAVSPSAREKLGQKVTPKKSTDQAGVEENASTGKKDETSSTPLPDKGTDQDTEDKPSADLGRFFKLSELQKRIRFFGSVGLGASVGNNSVPSLQLSLGVLLHLNRFVGIQISGAITGSYDASKGSARAPEFVPQPDREVPGVESATRTIEKPYWVASYAKVGSEECLNPLVRRYDAATYGSQTALPAAPDGYRLCNISRENVSVEETYSKRVFRSEKQPDQLRLGEEGAWDATVQVGGALKLYPLGYENRLYLLGGAGYEKSLTTFLGKGVVWAGFGVRVSKQLELGVEWIGDYTLPGQNYNVDPWKYGVAGRAAWHF